MLAGGSIKLRDQRCSQKLTLVSRMIPICENFNRDFQELCINSWSEMDCHTCRMYYVYFG